MITFGKKNEFGEIAVSVNGERKGRITVFGKHRFLVEIAGVTAFRFDMEKAKMLCRTLTMFDGLCEPTISAN